MTLKVISLNLWWGGNLFPAILKFLKEKDADIVALQEVHDGRDSQLMDRQRSMEVLQKHLNYPYHDFAQALLLNEPEGKIPSGNAVLSKFRILQSSASFLIEPTLPEYRDIPEHWPVFPRVLQHVQLETSAGEVNVFNMHGVWDLDGDRDSEARRMMFNVITDEIKGRQNVILAGDSNATLGNPLWRSLEGLLTNVFDDGLKTTFNMRRKDDPGYAAAAVDVMYASPNIKVFSADCPNIDISDHLPLIVTIEL